MKRLWKDYNLGIVLGLLFLLSWIGQLIVQWFNWPHEQMDHNQPLQVGSFLWQFWATAARQRPDDGEEVVPIGVAAVLTGLLTMVVAAALVTALVVLLNRVPHDTQ
jgi:hypothetical protein